MRALFLSQRLADRRRVSLNERNKRAHAHRISVKSGSKKQHLLIRRVWGYSGVSRGEVELSVTHFVGRRKRSYIRGELNVALAAVCG